MNKAEKKDLLTDLALPTGVLLVVTILASLGVTNDLFGRLMRNRPDELIYALICAVVGVSLPVMGRLWFAWVVARRARKAGEARKRPVHRPITLQEAAKTEASAE